MNQTRIIDANANRAGEGLRTIEEATRLVYEDLPATARVKALRHRLGDICKSMDRATRLSARSTATDVGTAIYAESEMERLNVAAVVSAAAERVTQSLRSLEEFSKSLSVDLSQRFKQLRYEAYDVLAFVELRILGSATKVPQGVYLLIDCGMPIEGFERCLQRLADAGVSIVQLRDKRAEGRVLAQYTRAAVHVLRSTECKVVVNDRVDIALACGAAGVHLGQDDMSLGDAQRLVQGKCWIGVSTHDVSQASEAEANGADYIGCGPMFHSTTKQFVEFPGPEFLAKVLSTITIPVFAIGGIDRENVSQLIAVGCKGVAVSGAIHNANDPVETVQRLKAVLLSS